MSLSKSNGDIRWQQRFNSYNKALSQLTEAVALAKQRPLSALEKQGLVKAFEFTHELAWKVMKDYFIYQGTVHITGSRDATREAFQNQLIAEGETWMEMIISRNQAVHMYDETVINAIIEQISQLYTPLFIQFKTVMQGLTCAK